MNRLRIRHVTGFTYDSDVTASYNEARMLPSSTDGQLVIESRLDIAPVSSTHTVLDYWGTRVACFDVLTPHRELTLTATSVVEVRPRRAATGARKTWEELTAATTATTRTLEQLTQTPRTEPPAEVVALAEEIAGRQPDPSLAAREICLAVGDAIAYVQGVTSVHTSAADAWAQRKGVCQDIVHLALGALRSVGIPARYVSGYLHPRPDAEIGEVVVGESHAWLEWYTGGGWIGFDPTNTTQIGEWHVLVGRGRDYADVPPLRGVYTGSDASKLFVDVELTREA